MEEHAFAVRRERVYGWQDRADPERRQLFSECVRKERTEIYSGCFRVCDQGAEVLGDQIASKQVYQVIDVSLINKKLYKNHSDLIIISN